LRSKLNEINVKEKRQSEQTINAEKILNSLNQFESNLKPDESGMTQIINEIDALGKTHKILTGNASYRVEEAAAGTDGNGNPAPQAAPNNKGNIYPALGIETTVTGDYPNLRRFLIDLERSKQFLIIRSLSFQGEDRGRLAAAGGRPGPQIQLSSPEAIPVSLKIEFDTYFRKPPKRGQ
jgi:Type II secretion system (T2SS), protein M subtype b